MKIVDSACRAVVSGDIDSVRVFLSDHPDLLDTAGSTGTNVLHVACWANQPQIAAILVSRGADVNAVGQNGMTPLHYAVYEGNATSSAVVHGLITAGADPTVTDDRGLTAEDLASSHVAAPGLKPVLAAFRACPGGNWQ